MELIGQCPDLTGGLEKYFIQSKLQNPPSYSLHLNIFPCTLPSAADCASPSEFKGAEIYGTNTRRAFDAANFTHPLTTILEFDGLEQLDTGNSKVIYHTFRQNEVWDDTQDFFDMKLRIRASDYTVDYRDSRSRDRNKVHCDLSVVNDPLQTVCKPYMKFVYSSGTEKRIIVRTYSKFFNTLGEIGGTAEIFVLFAFLFYFKYNDYFLDKFVMKEGYKVDSLTELKKHIKKTTNKKGDKGFNIDTKPILSLPRARINQVSDISQATRGNTQKEKKKEEKATKEILNEQIEENMNGVALFTSLNEMKLLRKILLKPRQRKLLPLVLHNMKKEELAKEEKKEEKDKKGKAKNYVEGDEWEKEMSISEALDKLTDHNTPKSEIEQAVDDFLLKYLPVDAAPRNQADGIPSTPVVGEVQLGFGDERSPAENHTKEPSPVVSVDSGEVGVRSIVSVHQPRIPMRQSQSRFGGHINRNKQGTNQKKSLTTRTLTLQK